MPLLLLKKIETWASSGVAYLQASQQVLRVVRMMHVLAVIWP
jgi:hypothetical protein